jgi:hypothetical protein
VAQPVAPALPVRDPSLVITAIPPGIAELAPARPPVMAPRGPASLPPTLNPFHINMVQPPAPAGPPANRPPGEPANDITIQLEPPDPIRLFGRLENEETLHKRMVEEARERQPMERITFPDTPILSKEAYMGRSWPHRYRFVEPHYVCYYRLPFQQINAERYGWDFGAVHPLLSAGTFFAECVTLPYYLFTDPCRWDECSAGQCLPGDPVPFLLYPPELSLTGTFAEAATIMALVAIFP